MFDFFFSEIHCSHGCFFSNFHTKTPFSHALTWSKYDQKPILYFCVRCFPHFLLKTQKMRDFLFSMAMVLWKRFCHFFINKNFLLYALVGQNILEIRFFRYFISALEFLLKNLKNTGLFAFS